MQASCLFFFLSKVGLPLMGYTAVQYTDCYLSPCQVHVLYTFTKMFYNDKFSQIPPRSCRHSPRGHSTKHGLDWTGQLDWTIGLDSWTGQLDWTVGLDNWTGQLDWTIGLDSWTGQLDWTVGLDYWTGFRMGFFPLNRRNLTD